MPKAPPPQPPTPTLDLAKAARLQLALTGAGEELSGLTRERDAEVVRTLLKNPNLAEQHLVTLLKRRDLGEELIKAVARAPLAAQSRQLAMLLTSHPQTPASLLASLLPQLFLFELVTLTRTPGTTPDLKVAAERAILKRLPESELGNRIALARQGTPPVLEALLKQGEPRLLEAVLTNPRLKEAALHAFLTSAAATAETISMVARHPRWGTRPNLRLALLKNGKTPGVWFTLFLPTLGNYELGTLLSSKGLTTEQRAEVRQEHQKRHPSQRQQLLAAPARITQ